MYLKPASPLPIGGVLDNGFSLFRYSLKDVYPLALASAVLVAAIQRASPEPDSLASSGAYLLGAMATLAVSIFFYVPIIAKIDAIQGGSRIAAGDSLRIALRRYWPALGVGVLYGLMLVVGTLLFVIPGIYLGVSFVFAAVAVVVEGKGVTDSLQYAFDLVRGRWWRTAVLLTTATIVAVVVYVLLAFAVGILYVVQRGVPAAGEVVVLPWYIELVIMPVVASFLMPLFYALLMAMYAETKLRHEGSDIAGRIAAAQA